MLVQDSVTTDINRMADQHDGSNRKCQESKDTCVMSHCHSVSSTNGLNLSRTLKSTNARKAFFKLAMKC